MTAVDEPCQGSEGVSTPYGPTDTWPDVESGSSRRKPAEKPSGHTVTWTIDSLGVTGKVTCHEPEDADCRLVSDCECEEWRVERDEHGAFHRTLAYIDEPEIRHPMRPGSDCNVVEWLDDTGLVDCHEGPVESLRDGPIRVSYEEGYLWRFAGAES